MTKTRVHALISGRVTGVFFRVNTRQIAKRLNLTGYVRNTPEGKVEVVAEGEAEKVDELIEYLHKGPITAKVDNVDIKKEKYAGKFSKFEIKY